MTYSFVLILLASPCLGYAQDEKDPVKAEHEEKIKAEEMPAEALSTLQPFLEGAKKIKYYHEIDGDVHSYESKFKKNNRKFSIEFDKAGQLEDVEINIDLDELPEATKKEVVAYMEKTYDRYAFLKIQQQYSALETGLDDGAVVKMSMTLEKQVTNIRYEIEVEGKQDKEYGSYELLFDADGKFLQGREMVNRNDDNVIY